MLIFYYQASDDKYKEVKGSTYYVELARMITK